MCHHFSVLILQCWFSAVGEKESFVGVPVAKSYMVWEALCVGSDVQPNINQFSSSLWFQLLIYKSLSYVTAHFATSVHLVYLHFGFEKLKVSPPCPGPFQGKSSPHTLEEVAKAGLSPRWAEILGRQNRKAEDNAMPSASGWPEAKGTHRSESSGGVGVEEGE